MGFVDFRANQDVGLAPAIYRLRTVMFGHWTAQNDSNIQRTYKSGVNKRNDVPNAFKMCCLRSNKQRGTLTEYLSTFFGLELFRVQNASHPQGPFYEGSRWVLDILQPRTTQIFSE